MDNGKEGGEEEREGGTEGGAAEERDGGIVEGALIEGSRICLLGLRDG